MPMTPGRRFAVSAGVTALSYSAIGFTVGNFPMLGNSVGVKAFGLALWGFFGLSAAGIAAAFIRVLLQWRALPSVPVQPRTARDATSLSLLGLCGVLLFVPAGIVVGGAASRGMLGSFSGQIAHLGSYAILGLCCVAGGLIATPDILAVVRKGVHPSFRSWAARESASFAGALCGPLLAAALWNLAGAVALSRIETEVRRVGYPVAAAPSRPPLADQDNGAYFFRKLPHGDSLADVWERGADEASLRDFLKQASLGGDIPPDYKLARRIVARHAGNLRLWEQGAACLRADWGSDPAGDPVSAKSDPRYSGMVAMSRVLAARAVLQAHDGRGREAVESVRLGLLGARSLGQQDYLLGAMVRTLLEDRALEAARAVLREVPPRLAQDRWNSLLDPYSTESGFWKAVGHAHFSVPLEACRISWWDLAFGRYRGLAVDRSVFGIGIPAAGLRRATRFVLLTAYWPFLKLDVASGLRGSLELDQALKSHDYPRQQEYYALARRILFKEWTLAAIRTPNYWDAHQGMLVGTANLRLARAALAARIFKEESGRWPNTVDDLEGFAKERFDDPFSTLRLRLGGGSGAPLLYSVGPDLRDDGGAAYDGDTKTGDLVWQL